MDTMGNHQNRQPGVANWTLRRRRNIVVTGKCNESSPQGNVCSMEGALRANLAKLCGNVDPRAIVVEGWSRTDRGDLATGMVAQIYYYNPRVLEMIENTSLNTTRATTAMFGEAEGCGQVFPGLFCTRKQVTTSGVSYG